MGCGCGGNRNSAARAIIVSQNIKSCNKCGSRMIYKQQFNLQLKSYMKVWECPNKRCNNIIKSK